MTRPLHPHTHDLMGLFTLAIGIPFIVTGCGTILKQIQFRIGA
jgi:hypothetical protein